MHMHGRKFSRPDLQDELIRRVRDQGVVHVIDSAGFVVVHSNDTHQRLEVIAAEIGTDALGLEPKECTWWSSESLEWYREKAELTSRQGIPYVEYETIGNPPGDWLARQDAPAVWHLYGMILAKPQG
jgi:hypothetical protein